MSGDQQFEIHGREDIAIVNQHILIADPSADIAQAPAGFEQQRLVKQSHGGVIEAALFDLLTIPGAFAVDFPRPGTEAESGILPDPGQVMGIDREIPHSQIAACLPGMADERLVKKRHQRFGYAIRQRSQPCPQSGTQKKSLRHGRYMDSRDGIGEHFSFTGFEFGLHTLLISAHAALMSDTAIMIAGTGSYVPDKILTNAELEKRIETSDEWITTRTGIKERRIAADDEFTSHMATKAGLKALEQANLAAEDVELIIVATITPDTFTPATACYVQQNIGARKAIAFDISAACSGFLYSMEIARKMIAGGTVSNALIIGAEKLSAFVNWNDRGTCILFGDGAGAAVLRKALPDEGRILAMELGTDGSLTHLLNIPGGGSAIPTTKENADEQLATLAMLGKEVFKHAVNHMRQSAENVISRAGLQAADIACVIPHQANLRIIDAIADRLEVGSEKVFVNLHKYGNTSAAAVAIALDEAHRSGAFVRGDNIVLVVFGAGLTWAAAAIQW